MGTQLAQKEDVLQAVLVADSFNRKFGPLVLNRPTCLLPLLNTPILDHTLQWLCVAGVQELFLCVQSHPNRIKDHLQQSRWDNNSMSVSVIVCDGARSVGDVLRDLDAKGTLRTDFLLLSDPDVISNLPLKPLMKMHRDKCKFDRSNVMTVVVRKACPDHRSRLPDTDLLLVTHPGTDRLLQLQHSNGRRLGLPLELFQENPETDIRFDLSNTGLSVCTPAVPPLFSDNFDYQTMDDLVKGVLQHEETLGNSIYLHVLEGRHYAGRVTNLRGYHAVSRDLMQRWVYPVVPDGSYSHHPGNIYKGDVRLARGCVLEEDVLIGSGTSIGKDSTIKHASVGRNCTIGCGVHISDSHLMDGCIIGDGCQIRSSLLAEGVCLGKEVNLKSNCVLGEKVKIKSGWSGEGQRMIASDGGWALYESKDGSDSEEESDGDLIDAGVESDSTASHSDREDTSLEDLSLRGSPAMVDDSKIFKSEVEDSLTRGLEERVNCENLILEINSSKYAYNVSMAEVNSIVTKAALQVSHNKSAATTTPQLISAMIGKEGGLTYFLPLFRNYIKSADSQGHCLAAIEEWCASDVTSNATLPTKIFHFFYQHDILSEDSVLQWYQSPPDNPDVGNTVRKQVEPFVKWLQEAEEEEDDSDDSD